MHKYVVFALVPGIFLCALLIFSRESSWSLYNVAAFIMYIFQMRKLRLRKIEGLANILTTSKWWSQILVVWSSLEACL